MIHVLVGWTNHRASRQNSAQEIRDVLLNNCDHVVACKFSHILNTRHRTTVHWSIPHPYYYWTVRWLVVAYSMCKYGFKTDINLLSNKTRRTKPPNKTHLSRLHSIGEWIYSWPLDANGAKTIQRQSKKKEQIKVTPHIWKPLYT